MDQYAGMDKWESDTKKKYSLLHTRKWKGHSNFTLERFLQQHWNAYISMQACNEHVRHQLQNEYTRIGCVLNTIEISDAPPLVTMEILSKTPQQL